MKFVKPTPKVIAEYRAQRTDPVPEKDIESLKLPDGDPQATRLIRRPNGELTMVAPWILGDVFSI